MAVAVSSESFTMREMRAGTVPTAWYTALGVTTLYSLNTTPVGNGLIMMTATWE